MKAHDEIVIDFRRGLGLLRVFIDGERVEANEIYAWTDSHGDHVLKLVGPTGTFEISRAAVRKVGDDAKVAKAIQRFIGHEVKEPPASENEQDGLSKDERVRKAIERYFDNDCDD